ncbi:hypothetical protein SAMN04488587_2017 [Methanococcoides vulcani]|uniref:Uncharacterized protein n=1 Tax=Methanococcoides vulcani TaxID=1353158 RepID=A0A1I0B6V7_9EURY|nr:hypothetical protein SAMN04488587_2017 [Methanococcoides vulcani]
MEAKALSKIIFETYGLFGYEVVKVPDMGAPAKRLDLILEILSLF